MWALLLGLFAMHALGTHGAMGETGMQMDSPVAAASAPARPAINTTTSTNAVALTHAVTPTAGVRAAAAASSLATAGLADVRATAGTTVSELVRAPSSGAMSMMTMLCVSVLTLALVLLLGSMAAGSIRRSVLWVVGSGVRPVGFAAARVDRRPPDVWEHSVLRC